jgi:hypothetical protein
MNEWKYKFFYVDEFLIAGTDMKKALKMMDLCIQKATEWINQNGIKEFQISHDLSTYESPGMHGQMATVVVVYKD